MKVQTLLGKENWCEIFPVWISREIHSPQPKSQSGADQEMPSWFATQGNSRDEPNQPGKLDVCYDVQDSHEDDSEDDEDDVESILLEHTHQVCNNHSQFII